MTKNVGSVQERSSVLRGLAITFTVAFALLGFATAASAEIDDQ